MEYCILIAILIFAGLFIWSLLEVKKGKEAADLKKLVAWVVLPENHIRWNIPLWAHIKDAQLHCNIPDQYRISWDEEKDYVNDIIEAFQKDLVNQFFCGSITHKKVNEFALPKETAKYTDFFLFRLFCFLSDHHCDGHILGHDVYGEQISYKSHGMWGDPLYDAVYEFSDFGRTVHKLYYITFMACKESAIYKDNIAGWLTPEHFTKDLDSNQTHLVRR